MTWDPLPWQNIDDVLFDMDGTLLDLAFDNHFWTELLPQRMGAAQGLPTEEARARLAPIFERTRGTLDWYCIDFWGRQTGLDLAQLKQEVAHGVRLLPETMPVLEALRGRGKRLWLVTNAHPETLTIKLDRAPIAHCFDTIVSSHELGAPKEHRAFWEGLRQRHPFDPARAMLVDDTRAVLAAGRAFGLAHVVAAAWPDRTGSPQSTPDYPSVLRLTELLELDAPQSR